MFDKIKIAALHAKLDAAMKEFAAENGLVAGASRIKYGATLIRLSPGYPPLLGTFRCIDFKVELSFGDKTANPNESIRAS